MNRIRFILKRPSFYYLLYLAIGISQVRNVGISWDEPAMRGLGASAAKYLVSLLDPNLLQNFQDLPQFAKIQDFQRTPDGDHGVIFELGLLSIEAIFKLSNNPVLLWQVRHLFTFLFCSLSIILMFKFLKWRFDSLSIAYFGTIAFILTPRIYGDSFYNEKDSVLLTSYFAATYFLIRFLSERTIKNSLLAGISLGFSVAIRPVSSGLLLIFLLLYFLSKIKRSNSIGSPNPLALPLFLIVSVSSTFAFFPYLWADPVQRAIKVFITASAFPWTGNILTNGQLYNSLNLPWFYIFLWIGVTIPLVYIPFLIFGVFAYPLKIYSNFQENQSFDWTKRDLADLFIYLSALGPLTAVILLNSTLYDGWRHLYFIYPPLLLIGIQSFIFLVTRMRSYPFWIGVLLSLIFLNFLTTAQWMFVNKPLQNVYFNQLAGNNIRENWEMDYWGLGNRKSLEYLLSHDASQKIELFVSSATPLFRSLDLINQIEAQRIELVSDINQAKYVFTNYRDANVRNDTPFESNFTEYYTLHVGDAHVNTLLIRK